MTGVLDHGIHGELHVAVTHRYAAARVDDQLFEELLDLVRWRQVPRFPAPGRTAWHELDSPASYDGTGGATFHAVKLKGVGAWNPGDRPHSGVRGTERSPVPTPPSSSEYEATGRMTHVGTTPEGELTVSHSEPAPYGGILHARAVAEFDNAAVLLGHGVPSIGPLLVAEYPGLRFRQQPMGAVLCLSPDGSPCRVHVDYVDDEGPEAAAYFRDVYRLLEIDGDPRLPIVQWAALHALARRAGALLRQFAEAGLFRYSMWLENLQFDRHRRQLFLTDLDSSARLEDISAERRPLEILRDVASALHKIAWRLHYFVALDPWPLDRLRVRDPFAAFLTGYFGEEHAPAIAEAMELLWRVMVPHLFIRKRLRSEMTGWNRERIRSYEVDRSLFYAMCMVLTLPLFEDGSLSPHFFSIDRRALAHKIERFLGPEGSDYLSWLLR
jgi:hypothetical protein